MEESCDTKQQNKKERENIKKQFFVISCGITLVYSGYSATLSLQSSINIENGEGSAVTAIAYTNALILSFFVVSNLVRFLGIKSSILLSEVFLIQYQVGNMIHMHYKDSVSLQVSATISGIGEAIFWVPITLVAVHFCKKYHKVAPMLSEESCFAKMAGIMFPIFILNDVLGNIVVYAVLKVSSAIESNKQSSIGVQQTFIANSTVDLYARCGANDCQQSNVTSEHLGKYVPAEPAVYAFLACNMLVQCFGVFIHHRFVPDVQMSHVNNDEHQKSTRITSIHDIMNPIRRTFKLFFCNKKQWLLFIPGSYAGMSAGFYASELTRAYASCTIGVENVWLFGYVL